MNAQATTPPGLVVRETSASDNQGLIDLELQCPIVMEGAEETSDRSPDFFACHRVQGIHRVVLAELRRRLVGSMAGTIQSPMVRGRPRRLVYIQRGRIHPDYQRQGIAWKLATDLFAWSQAYGARGMYYLIAPGNQRSVAFGGRAGREWPVRVRLLGFDVSGAGVAQARRLDRGQMDAVVELVNRTHAGEDFFEPLTTDSLAKRLSRDGQYGVGNLFGVVAGEQLVAVAGLWDKGAFVEHIRIDRVTGLESRSRSALVVDWGWVPGHESAFAGLLRSLAHEAGGLGRSTLTVCEPAPGKIPDPGLPCHETNLSLYTPTIEPPDAGAIKGLFLDLLTM